MKHTRGNWFVKGKRIRTLYPEMAIEPFAINIAEVEEQPELEANAKLIAAAPDLLSALIFCQSVIKSQGMFDRSEQMAYDKAEAAIKKATV